MEKKAEGNVLSLAAGPAKHRPKSEPAGLIVRLPLVLTVEGSNLPFVLAFCAGQDECFLVKAGARSAVCHQCDARHEVIGLIEALEERQIVLGGDNDDPWPVLKPEMLIGAMFRAIQKERRSRAAGPAEGDSGKAPKGGAS